MTPSPKCYVSLSKPPAARKKIIHPFNHEVNLLLPTNIYDNISQSLLESPAFATPPIYHRLMIPLSAILEPDFFHTFIKSGDILLLSQGQLDVDNIFCLSDGVLRMSLDTESYEKAGIQGRPARFGNGPGVMKRRRFLVELNLRSSSYLTGSKSMDRLKRACENVFQEPRAFLFADLSSSGPTQFTQPSTSPTTLTAPHILTEFPPRKITPAIDRFPDVRLPAFLPPPGSRPHGGGKSLEANYNREVWRDWLMELSEYLSLLLLPSGPADRVKTSDTVDPYLSTYAIDCSHEGSITRIRFSGFIAEKWINQLWSKLVELLDATKLLVDSKQIWAAIAVYGFDNAPIGWNGKEMGGLRGCGNGYAVLRLPEENGEMTWEIVGPQDEY